MFSFSLTGLQCFFRSTGREIIQEQLKEMEEMRLSMEEQEQAKRDLTQVRSVPCIHKLPLIFIFSR